MLKLILALRNMRGAFAANQFASAAGYVADVLESMGKEEAAKNLRDFVAGVKDEDAHDIAVAAAREVFDLLEGYYGESFPHVKVMALADNEACAKRAEALAEYMGQHTEVGVTGSGRLKAVPPEVWAALANVLASFILNLINKHKAGE